MTPWYLVKVAGLAKWIWLLILFTFLALVVFFSIWGGQWRAKIEAELLENQVEAATESGADAVNSVAGQGAREDEIDALTRENRDEILEAEGADAPVADDVNAAGLRALCKRAAYSSRPECVQRTAPRRVDEGR